MFCDSDGHTRPLDTVFIPENEKKEKTSFCKSLWSSIARENKPGIKCRFEKIVNFVLETGEDMYCGLVDSSGVGNNDIFRFQKLRKRKIVMNHR